MKQHTTLRSTTIKCAGVVVVAVLGGGIYIYCGYDVSNCCLRQKVTLAQTGSQSYRSPPSEVEHVSKRPSGKREGFETVVASASYDLKVLSRPLVA
jgi:hypothetical protein